MNDSTDVLPESSLPRLAVLLDWIFPRALPVSAKIGRSMLVARFFKAASVLLPNSMSHLTDPEAAHRTLRLIDDRQDQILEDLDRLNDQIEAIILLNSAQREEEQEPTDKDGQETESPIASHPAPLEEAA